MGKHDKSDPGPAPGRQRVKVTRGRIPKEDWEKYYQPVREPTDQADAENAHGGPFTDDPKTKKKGKN